MSESFPLSLVTQCQLSQRKLVFLSETVQLLIRVLRDRRVWRDEDAPPPSISITSG